jgi:hypothetical protein
MVGPQGPHLMDDPANDSLQAGPQGEQQPADNLKIVRRIEITVERETTTVILRRRTGSPGQAIPPKPRAAEDSDNTI